MKIYHDPAACPKEGRVLALGFFDGVHRGHQELLKTMRYWAGETGLVPAVFTFRDAPARLFDKETFPGLLQEEEARMRVLGQLGAREIIALPLLPEILSLSPQAFLERILRDQLDARLVIVGQDFRFGSQARGQVDLLASFCQAEGIRLILVDDYIWEGETLSSTLIRQRVQAGKMEEAASMMGRPYAHEGLVRQGRQIGRKLGFPTLNLVPDPKLVLPPFGVYLSKVHYQEGTGSRALPAVSNLGVQPTVSQEGTLASESFILLDHYPGYGCPIRVEYLHFERPEIRFSSQEALRQQVLKDIDRAKAAFQLSF